MRKYYINLDNDIVSELIIEKFEFFFFAATTIIEK